MKKLLVGVLVFTILFCFSGCSGATGENVSGVVTTENMVYFEPKCPECKHIGRTMSVNLCKGEDYNDTHFCEECGKIFDFAIKR